MHRSMVIGFTLLAAMVPVQGFAGPVNLVQTPGFAFSGPYVFPGYKNQPFDWTLSGAAHRKNALAAGRGARSARPGTDKKANL
jgi:hypothetical protein